MSTPPKKSPLQFTDEQARALGSHQISVALAAGAGCGKTFVLTERFLSYLDPRLLEPCAELDELVAITFTDAAAREMRDRIRKRCYERLAGAESADEAQAWRRLLRILDTARISTIHSFCAALLRSHAVEAQLDPRFEQLDQASADLLRMRTLDERLRQLLLERNEAVIQLATHFTLRGLREHLATLLGEDLEATLRQWQGATPDRLIATWKAHYAAVSVPQAVADFLASPPVGELRRICATGSFGVPELGAHCADRIALPRVAQQRGAAAVAGGAGSSGTRAG